MVQHPALDQWEAQLKKLLDDLDDLLEEKFGSTYTLHPSRPKRGSTANKSHDGLFDIVAGYSMGLGSEHGKGYIIDIHMSTLDQVPEKIKNQIDQIALSTLQEKLPDIFPGKNLKVIKDGNLIKLTGDLSLGEI